MIAIAATLEAITTLFRPSTQLPYGSRPARWQNRLHSMPALPKIGQESPESVFVSSCVAYDAQTQFNLPCRRRKDAFSARH